MMREKTTIGKRGCVQVGLFIGMLFVSGMMHAQGFMMSSVGMLGTSSSNAPAIIFRSSALCIDVQSGIAVFNGVNSSATGEFAINCIVKQQFNSFGIKLFPNPANVISKLKFTNTPPLQEVFNVSVWSTEGAILNTRKETGYNLFQGIMLDVSRLVAGSYILKIESAQSLDALKFIKVN